MKRSLLITPLVLAATVMITAQQPKGVIAPSPKPAAAPAPPPVEIRTSVSQTAVWPGDHVTYLVELRCAPHVDILTDDLEPDQLRVEGLEILETASQRDASVTDRVVHRMRYTLATYSVDAAALTIAAIPVRYSVRQPGQKAEEALPAGEVLVPPLTLGLRSTIPASEGPVIVRDQRPAQPLPRRVRYAEPLGLALVVLAIAPVAFWAVDLVRRARRVRPARVRRATPRERRAALDELRALDVSSEPARRDAYARLDAWIKEHVQLSSGVAAAALTPAELSRLRNAARTEGVADVERLLIECERAKYAPEPPPADRWPGIVDEAAELKLPRRR